MNYVFENVTGDIYTKIKSFLEQKFEKIIPTQAQNCISSFQFFSSGHKISILYYTSLRLMIQGNDIEEFIAEIEKRFSITRTQGKSSKPIEIHKKEAEIKKEFLIGFDESGKGECFGQLFLCAAKIKSSELAYFQKVLGKRDIKKLDWSTVEKLFNFIKDKFEYEILQIPPNKLDEFNLTLLMDEGYASLTEKVSKNAEKEAYFVDDYGTSIKLQTKMSEQKARGSEIIIAKKADVNYTACMIASLAARRTRNKEMERLSSENILIDPATGKKISFKSGAPNSETERYLITFRKLFPSIDFPDFVRKSWANIQKLDANYPKKKCEISYTCLKCNKESNIVCMHILGETKESEFFCASCGETIPQKEINCLIKCHPIVVDTSVILSRTISKDLNSKRYFDKCSFIFPSFLYEEIDSKQPAKKTGGVREIDDLKIRSRKGEISIKNVDMEDYRDIQIDKKFMHAVRTNDGIMLTKDNTLAGFSTLGSFVIRLIEYRDLYFKQITASEK